MKKVREFSKEELAEYKHYDYMKHREKRIEYQKKYNREHQEKINERNKARYKKEADSK